MIFTKNLHMSNENPRLRFQLELSGPYNRIFNSGPDRQSATSFMIQLNEYQRPPLRTLQVPPMASPWSQTPARLLQCSPHLLRAFRIMHHLTELRRFLVGANRTGIFKTPSFKLSRGRVYDLSRSLGATQSPLKPFLRNPVSS